MRPVMWVLLPCLVVLALAGWVLAGNRLPAQPGTETDPVVSVSYLEAALRSDAIVLEGGEVFALQGGRGVALIEGRCMLSPPEESRCWILDITRGQVLSGAVEMIAGHWYLPMAEAGEGALFSLQTYQTSTLAVPAGAVGE